MITGSWDFGPETRMRCEQCGWTGTGDETSTVLFRDLLQVDCPDCDARLALVPHPTHEETRAAATAGNARAQAEPRNVKKREARWRRADEVALGDLRVLPRLSGRRLTIDWDLEADADGEKWVVLRHRERLRTTVLWRELAYWEGIERFEEVVRLLARRYGRRLVEVKPSTGASNYLLGDRIGWIGRIERINAQLLDGTIARDA
jgi:hypothetical protein